MATEFYRVQHLRGSTAQWAANDLVIAEGEIAVELGDTAMRIKVGDGSRLWSELPYTSGQDDVARSDIQTLEIDLAAVAGDLTALTVRTDTLEADMAAVQADLLAAVTTPAGTVAGAILYYDGGTWQATPAGDPGRVLTAAGAGAPTWQPQAGALVYQGSFDPTAGPEYPATPAQNDLWSLAVGHTWTTGELDGETGAAGDLIAYNGSVWSLIPLGGGSSIDQGSFAAPSAAVVRHLRSDTAGASPPAGVEREGALAVNRADRQIFSIDAAGTGRAMLAARIFDAAAQYAIGDYAIQGNRLWRALTTISPGAFVATQWAPVGSVFVTTDGVAPVAPGPVVGDLWFDTTTLTLKIWAIVGGTPGWQSGAGAFLPLAGGAITGNLSIGGTLAYGKAAALASGFDLNGLTVPGAYDVADPVNGPGGGSANWLVEVLRYSGDPDHVAQRATKLAPLSSSPTPYYRSRTASGWLAWITVAPGSGIGAPVRITASTDWTPPPGCVRFKVQLQAPGGGGGGANGTATNASAQGSGGGGGCYIEDVLDAGAGPYSITIGAPGNGGAANAGNGTAGGNVRITDGGALDLVAGGGGAGAGMSGTNGSGGTTGAAGGEAVTLTGASAAVLVIPGGHGNPGRVVSGLNTGPATGGDGQLGRGRHYRGVGSGIGDPGSGYGGGGGGGRAGSTTSNYAGGDGAPGVVIITPYF